MRKKRILSAMLLTVALVCAHTSMAQTVALKTNLITDALTTPNIGMEIGLAQKWTVQATYALNPWTYSGSGPLAKKAKHWVVMPEARYWTCSKMNGWFVGLHAMGGQFNAANIKAPVPGAFFSGLNIGSAVKDSRVQGGFAGGGVTAGYQWILSRHWNLEAEAGVGYDRIWYKQYPCAECGTMISEGHSNYVGLTKLGLSLMYVF